MKYFKSSAPNQTKIKNTLSYKGIPTHGDNGEPIHRKIRLSIAKEIQKLKQRNSVADLYHNNEFIKTFDTQEDALEYLETNVAPVDYDAYDIKLRPRENIGDDNSTKVNEELQLARDNLQHLISDYR